MSLDWNERAARRACDRCLARSWLIDRLAAHLEPAPRPDLGDAGR